MPSLTAPGTRRSVGRSSVAILALTLGVAACATAATPNPAASTPSAATSAASAAPATPPVAVTAVPSAASAAPTVASATPVAGGGSAADWCAFVIEINTKYGYMTNKNYSRTPPTLDVQRQILDEALSRLDEWVAKTPPEITDATAAEILYFQQVKAYGDANGWTDPAKFPQMTPTEGALIATLVPYQIAQCGITFGK